MALTDSVTGVVVFFLFFSVFCFFFLLQCDI
jgi:hypothetical protein